MHSIESIREQVAALACPGGGWGYASGQRPQIEPTCWALLALVGSSRWESAVANGLWSLNVFRKRDGSYRLDRGREEAVWGTSLGLLALSELRFDAAKLDETASFLLGVRGKPGQEDPETDNAFDINIRLIGWPWAEGTFSWVEPTAWACLALQKIGQSDHPRVQEGLKVLLDRAFDAGGANYGNKKVLDKFTDPIPGPSAILLLALQRHHGEPRVKAALDYVRADAAKSTDIEHLALTKLALAAHGQAGLAHLDERLYEALGDQRSWAAPSPVKLALAGIALRAPEHNPLLIGDVHAPPLAERPLPVRKTPLVERIRTGFKGMFARGLERMRQPPARSIVHIAKADDYECDVAGIIRAQYEHFREMVPLAGRCVVLKPNLVEYHKDKVINTDPRVIGAVIDLCQKEGAAEVIVAEGPGHWRNVQYLVAECGLGEILDRYGVKFVDINHDEPEKLLNLGRLTGLEHLFVSQTVASADVLISMPKLKTHHWAGATLSLKNLFGILPGTCYGWPKNELHWRGIAESIIDIALTCTPHLAVIDGIVGMEGDGPLNGSAHHVGALLMSNDLVAADATGCRLMGLTPERIVHIVLGAHKRLGRIKADEIEQVGEAIESLAQQFVLPPRFEKIALPAADLAASS